MTRALLTDREREILRGEATDVSQPAKYRSNTRGRIRERLDRIEKDIEVLDEYEPEMAEQLREELCHASVENNILEVVKNIETKLDEIQNES